MEINLYGSWRVTQAFLPLLKKSAHPRLVNVASGAGSHGDMQFGLTTNGGSSASYGISKAALNALTVKFAAELAGTGVLVNAVCPGLTATAPGMEAMGARPIPEGAASIVWAATPASSGQPPCRMMAPAAASSATANRWRGEPLITASLLIPGLTQNAGFVGTRNGASAMFSSSTA